MSIFVSICIATYKRSDGLSKLLDGINKLEFQLVEEPIIEVIVVDNDASASAKPVYERAKDTFRWNLIYDIEKSKGVSYARNRTISHISKESDFAVFIDDDEYPSKEWLDNLLSVQKDFEVDVVTGPVYPIFEEKEIPAWIHSGGFFNPPDRENGSTVHIAYTHNVIIKAELLKQYDIVFDNDFAFRGAEDVHLFMRLSKEGAKFAWAKGAIVYEVVPPQRTNVRWILDRNYYGWSSHSLLEKKIFPSPSRQFIRFVKGVALTLLGLILLIPNFIAGKPHSIKSLVYIYRGAGTISGLLNIQGAWGGANR